MPLSVVFIQITQPINNYYYLSVTPTFNSDLMKVPRKIFRRVVPWLETKFY